MGVGCGGRRGVPYRFQPGHLPARGNDAPRFRGGEDLRSPRFLALENYVDRLLAVIGVIKQDVGVRLPWVEVTEAGFQTEEEILPVLKIFTVSVYRRAPFICKRCQTRGSDFQIGHVP